MPDISQNSLIRANQVQNNFSGYKGALGEAGVKDQSNIYPDTFPNNAGDILSINSNPDGFGRIYIGCHWDVSSDADHPIDLDLGCLYELEDLECGCLQALGGNKKAFDQAPFIWLSQDDQTGEISGDNEYILVNGKFWNKIKRILVFAYIYSGPNNWHAIRPSITIKIPDQDEISIKPHLSKHDLPVCALALIEQKGGGILFKNLTEFFGGQAEMDRAYGFGIRWEDGHK